MRVRSASPAKQDATGNANSPAGAQVTEKGKATVTQATAGARASVALRVQRAATVYAMAGAA